MIGAVPAGSVAGTQLTPPPVVQPPGHGHCPDHGMTVPEATKLPFEAPGIPLLHQPHGSDKFLHRTLGSARRTEAAFHRRAEAARRCRAHLPSPPGTLCRPTRRSASAPHLHFAPVTAGTRRAPAPAPSSGTPRVPAPAATCPLAAAPFAEVFLEVCPIKSQKLRGRENTGFRHVSILPQVSSEIQSTFAGRDSETLGTPVDSGLSCSIPNPGKFGAVAEGVRASVSPLGGSFCTRV
jgi:hypothetical protein